MKRVGVLLVAVTLIVGMTGGGGGVYALSLGIDADEPTDNIEAPAMHTTMGGDYSITSNPLDEEAANVGIKVGDWVRLDYTFTGLPDQIYPDWLKFEFLNVEGTVATVRFTQHLSDGTQQSDTESLDIAYNTEVPLLAGIVIQANQTIGDYVYIAGYGNITIEDEAIKTYAGANRTVLYTSFSHNEAEVTYYWDKLTGVMVELSSIYPELTATAKAARTNMWASTDSTSEGMPWWPWIIVGVVAVGLAIFLVRRKRTA